MKSELGVTERDEQKFWNNTKLNLDTGCLEWVAGRDWDGYGIFKINGKSFRAHRLALILTGKRLTKGKMLVCHKCDNPSCVNPFHLFIGTHSDNVRDCVNKGRQKEIRKTHCPHGHPFSGENLYVVPKTGKRQCVTCRTHQAHKASLKRRVKNERI